MRVQNEDEKSSGNRSKFLFWASLALLALAIFVALASVDFVTQATEGVWMIAVAIFIGIVVRILQAQSHHWQSNDAGKTE